jgi:hypothetical protein
MSNPSFENIDRWLFELMEGNLSPEQEAQLEAFLMQHPELGVDRDMWDIAKINVTQPFYENKKQLERRRTIVPYFVGFGGLVTILLGFLIIYRSNESNANFSASKSNAIKFSDVMTVRKTKVQNENKNNFISSTNSASEVLVGNQYLSSHFDASKEKNYTNEIQNIVQNQSDYTNNDIVRNEIALFNLKSMNEKQHDKLKLNLKTLDVAFKRNKNELKFSETHHYKNKEDKSKSIAFNLSEINLKSKAKRFANSVEKAMKNPVALINLKDTWYQVPGLTSTDVNFASVGSLLSTRIQSSTRLQWFGNENQQFSNQVAVDAYAHGIKGGIGFQMNHNFYGDGGIQNYNAALIYSPKIPLSAHIVIEPSVRFKMGSKQLNPESLGGVAQVEMDRFNAIDYYSNGSNPIGRTLWYRDLGAGLMLNTKWFFASFQADNLMQHYDNIYSADIENPRKAPFQYIASIGGEYMSKKRITSISPYLVYQHFGDLEEFWGGINYRYKWLRIGAAVSSNFEPSASLGLTFKHFTVAYNADYTKSALLSKSLFSHQLTLRFNTKPCRIGQRILAR